MLFYFKPSVRPETRTDPITGEVTLTGRTQLRVYDIRFGYKVITPGLLAENATQAVCRDLLARAMPRVEAAGYPIVLHTHDEIVAEVDEGVTHEGMVVEMCRGEPWSEGFPLAAAGFTAPRNRKDD
jgi:DNA polymerase bacteriophage-type